MMDETVERIHEIADIISTNIDALETLEIYAEQPAKVHLAFNTEKSENIPNLISFLENAKQYADTDEALGRKLAEQEFIYSNSKYTFNRVAPDSLGYTSVMFISRNEINKTKRGLIFVLDDSGVAFIATCKSDLLRKFNLDLMSVLYPN